ncbi:collagen alpha-1(I) chain-like [Maniola jurtina]|uniref:collagen alpha-1(I) chain-like n=1 Tax=Maniola jurtina TaxID=191418 RepID=UPI001E68A529|nr:collagen alpha-1(I) chain-like [Maniola jurtina]
MYASPLRSRARLRPGVYAAMTGNVCRVPVPSERGPARAGRPGRPARVGPAGPRAPGPAGERGSLVALLKLAHAARPPPARGPRGAARSPQPPARPPRAPSVLAVVGEHYRRESRVTASTGRPAPGAGPGRTEPDRAGPGRAAPRIVCIAGRLLPCCVNRSDAVPGGRRAVPTGRTPYRADRSDAVPGDRDAVPAALDGVQFGRGAAPAAEGAHSLNR